MNIEELSERYKLKANLDTDIKTYVFDDLSTVNTQDRNKSFPLILQKPPNSVITPFLDQPNSPLYENYAISFYIFTPWQKTLKGTDPLEVAYRKLEAIGDLYNQNVLASGGNTFSLIGDKSVTKTRGHHQHAAHLIGINYTYTLRVFNSLCYGLGQPTNLVAVPNTTTQIDLTWTDNATGETGYQVERSLDGINFSLITTEAADSTSYSDTGLTVDTQYYYRVRAVDANGGGQFSNIVAMRTDKTGVTQTGIAYDRPELTGKTTSFRTADYGNHLALGTYDITHPVYPVSYAQLDTFITLLANNAFGNTNRFTDDAGGQTYANDYVIDHLTGLGWHRLSQSAKLWNAGIDDAASSTQNSFSDWRLPHANEQWSIYDKSLNAALNYAPFSISTGANILTSSSNGADTARYSTVFPSNGGTISRAIKASNTGLSFLVRNHYT